MGAGVGWPGSTEHDKLPIKQLASIMAESRSSTGVRGIAYALADDGGPLSAAELAQGLRGRHCSSRVVRLDGGPG